MIESISHFTLQYSLLIQYQMHHIWDLNRILAIIRSKEVKIRFYLIASVVVYSILHIIYALWINALPSIKNYIRNAKFILIDIVLLTTNLMLYGRFKYSMKNNLNYHYVNNWSKIKFIFHFATAYLINWTMIDLLFIAFDLDKFKMISGPSLYKDWQRVLFLIFYSIANVWRFLYIRKKNL